VLALANTLMNDTLSSVKNEEGEIMVKPVDLTFEQVAALVAYDPASGALTWRVTVARNVKAGTAAGTVKTIRKNSDGEPIQYRYVRLLDTEVPAARLAWLLHNGEWPTRNVLFKDGDSLNLRADNLGYGAFAPATKIEGTRRSYRMSQEAQRHYGLKRYYGLTGEQYGAMLAEQKGVCAICGKPETTVVGAGVKPLSVDHCHDTNRIRGLLCHHCNHGLGHFMDSPAALRAAADYIERHRANADNVVPIKSPESEAG
jgi:hypothetical protein